MATRTAIGAGGSRGIGREIVRRLHDDGTQVVTCGRGRRPDDLPEGVEWVVADVSDPEQAEALVARARKVFGDVTVVVNNAGVQVERTVADSTDEDWDLVVGVNCRGTFNVCRSVLPQMESTGGAIVNIGSISGRLADPTMALYNASKAFVHGLTRSIAVDHGPHVRCNAVCPGWVTTDMAGAAFDLAGDSEAAERDAVLRHPAGRMGRPADIASVVTWLVSDEAAFVTGQELTVDGGLTSGSPLRPELF